MHKPTVCTLLTIGIYTGVMVFLVPYVFGHLSSGALLMIVGATLAVVSGFSRAFFTEGDCDLRTHTQRIP